MRAVFLIAMREFAENAKTKGFWIGLFLFPVMIYGSIIAQKMVNESTPTRHFVMVDQSGGYAAVVRATLEERYSKKVLGALLEYRMENSKESLSETKMNAESLENLPQGSMMGDLEKALDSMKLDLGDSMDQASIDKVLAMMAPDLNADRPEFVMPRPDFREVPLPASIERDGELVSIAEGLRDYLRGDQVLMVDGEPVELFAAILIPKDIDLAAKQPVGMAAMLNADKPGIQYWGTNLADTDLKERVSRAIQEELHRKQYVERNLNSAEIAAVLDMELPIGSYNPNKEVGKEVVSQADKIREYAPIGFVYLLWIGIFTISQMLLNNTIEEKSNRIIEVLLSSVTPGELMMGKLLGIAGVGITMIGVWMGSLVAILKLNSGPESELAGLLWDVLQNSGMIPVFIMYFILGYLLYSALFLSIGSVCNTLKEAQNLMGPVMLIMMVPMVTMMFIPKDPNGTLARVLSWIPLYTPFTMMNRAAAHPPMIDQVGTLILLLVSVVVAMWLAGRIFRIGILRTGQPPKFRELLSWLKTS